MRGGHLIRHIPSSFPLENPGQRAAWSAVLLRNTVAATRPSDFAAMRLPEALLGLEVLHKGHAVNSVEPVRRSRQAGERAASGSRHNIGCLQLPKQI